MELICQQTNIPKQKFTEILQEYTIFLRNADEDEGYFREKIDSWILNPEPTAVSPISGMTHFAKKRKIYSISNNSDVARITRNYSAYLFVESIHEFYAFDLSLIHI